MENDQELLILLEEFSGRKLKAKYSTFHLGLENDRQLKKYRLTARGHSGSAGDPFEMFQGKETSFYLLLLA